MEKLHVWMIGQRDLVPDDSAISRALDYSLKRWAALPRYLDDGAVPIDNNWCENQIRPWVLGRKNRLFAGLLRSGKRAAAIMSSIQYARLNGHDPHAYLKDVLTRLPTQWASEIGKLWPHQPPIELPPVSHTAEDWAKTQGEQLFIRIGRNREGDFDGRFNFQPARLSSFVGCHTRLVVGHQYSTGHSTASSLAFTSLP